MEGTSGGAGNEIVEHDIDWDDMEEAKFYFWNAVLFFAVRTVVYPPNLVKTRLQAQKGKSQYSGTLDAFRKIVKGEGMRGLYKGFITATIGTLPTQFTYITVYERLRAGLKPVIASELVRNFTGGAAASLCASAIGVPMDVISQLLMIQDGSVHKKRYNNGWDVVKDIWRREGMVGFYRGYWVSLFVTAPSSATWWATYSTLKRNVMRIVDTYTPLAGKADILFYGLSGSASGCFTAMLTNPLDVVKTRYQVLSLTPAASGDPPPKMTAWSTFKMVWADEGIRAFTKGLTARMMLMAQTSFMLVLSYETVKKLSRKQ